MPWLVPLRRVWTSLAPRERRLVGLAGAVVGLGLLMGLGLQPAWRTLQEAPARIAALEAQRLVMQGQAADAARWRAVPPLPSGQAGAALQAATQRLSPRARLSLQGDRAVLTFEALAPAELQAWLAEARAGARARPVEAQWSNQPSGLAGRVTLALPEVP
jgi:general secretion pathway protein M